MEIEKVKEIKKSLECCIVHGQCDCCIFREKHPFACLTEMHKQLLTLINELERANERLKDSNKNILFVNEHVIKQNDDLTKENERLKNRIATLERKLDAKESYYNAVKDRALEVFANKLIEKAIKLGWQGLGTTDIDETLKEILKNG